MSKKKRNRMGAEGNSGPLPMPMWQGEDGIHALVPGECPSPTQLEEMSLKFQEKIKHSPMWAEMVKQFGEKKAEELLKQCKAKLG